MIIKQKIIGEYTVTLKKASNKYIVTVNKARTTTNSEMYAFWLYETAVQECEKEQAQ